MWKRFWLLGVVALVSAVLLLACGSKYNSSSQGLLLVGSQGSNIIQTFSFDLNSGHAAAVANSTNDTAGQTCVLNGSPAGMVMHPSGAYSYAIFNASSQCPNATQPGIAAFQVKSDGTVSQMGDLVPDANPVYLAMDPAGKFLFVAEGTSAGLNVYSIGSGGTLSAAGSATITGLSANTPNIVAVAPTPTIFPSAGINGTTNAVCTTSGQNPPTSQYVYAVDSVNYLVWQFAVDTSSGALSNPPGTTTTPAFGTDAVPAGVAVDSCDRFVYVSGSLHNKISAYSICTAVTTNGPCQQANGALVEVPGSPFASAGSANGLGQVVVDPFGNYVYVVGTLSNTVSGFKISPVSGALTALNPATAATASQPKSITIRADDSWMFVTNYGSASVSQYSITPATGALSTGAAITTDNYPFGVAVK